MWSQAYLQSDDGHCWPYLYHNGTMTVPNLSHNPIKSLNACFEYYQFYNGMHYTFQCRNMTHTVIIILDRKLRIYAQLFYGKQSSQTVLRFSTIRLPCSSHCFDKPLLTYDFSFAVTWTGTIKFVLVDLSFSSMKKYNRWYWVYLFCLIHQKMIAFEFTPFKILINCSRKHIN